MTDVVLRNARTRDVEAIAAIHAQSWRDHYRGAYSDEFLDGEAFADRLVAWRARLADPDPTRFTVMAEVDGVPAGFAYAMLDEDPALGAVVQNIHVATPHQRNGVASHLIREVARIVVDRRPGSGLHVWVRERNASGAAFYGALGGMPAGMKRGGPFADGGFSVVLCFSWPDPSGLIKMRG